MHIKDKVVDIINEALKSLGLPEGMVEVAVDHPAEEKFGDYSTNVAMILMKEMGATAKNPLDLAKKISEKINELIKTKKNIYLEKAEAVAPGFVNIFLTKKFFTESIVEVLEKGSDFGKNTKLWNKKIIIEYTDPNPFKQFHIGHLMSNAIGESLSRILAFENGKITRACYQGDVGMHVAKAMWGILKLKSELPESGSVAEKTEFLGKAYVSGANAFEDDENAKKEIQDLNQKIYDKSDEEINALYEWGRKASLEHFDEIYEKLGSHFNQFIFESEVVDDGLQIVQTGLDKGIFEKSDGAVIFPGEKFGLHNRVFINSQGLPTYETKELGLTKKKFELDNFDESVVVTASEQSDYFKVIIKTLEQIYPEIARRMKHISHGMMRFSSGKMSSRKGNVVTGESLLEDLEEMALEKMKERDIPEKKKKEIAIKIAVGAIKYSILRQSSGKDIIFDPENALSFEGDSGPYIQYTYVRVNSIMKKAKKEGIESNPEAPSGVEELGLQKLIYKFPEIVERSAKDYASNYITTYITELSSAFNTYYAKNKILDDKDPASPYRLSLAQAVGLTLRNGLELLGISAPEEM